MGTIEGLVKKRFTDEHEKAAISLYVSANLMAAYNEKIIASYGITGGWLNVLRILRGQYPNPCTLSLISERIVDKKSDLSRMAKRLLKAGLAEHYNEGKDRRTSGIIISQKGMEILAELDKERDTLLKPITFLTTAEAVQLSGLLEKILIGLNS